MALLAARFWVLALCVAVLTVHLTHAGEEHDDDHNEGESHEDEAHKAHWSYHGEHGPDNWDDLVPLCSEDSKRQSPININHKHTVFEETLTPISLLEVTDRSHHDMTMVNNGHSVNVQVAHQALVLGGALPGDGYKVAGVHFHWGDDDESGSEHLVNTQAYTMEMHMVTYDSERYAELGDAVFGDNSLAVLGTFFTISAENNTAFDPIIRYLHEIRTAGNDTTIPLIALTDLLPKNTDKYFRYLGSLTTPPCAESVVWTLFLHLQKISSAQMKELRQLLEAVDESGHTYPIVDNWRPVQPLHGRIVYRSFLFRSEISEAYNKNHPGENSAAGHIVTSLTTLLASVMATLFF